VSKIQKLDLPHAQAQKDTTSQKDVESTAVQTGTYLTLAQLRSIYLVVSFWAWASAVRRPTNLFFGCRIWVAGCEPSSVTYLTLAQLRSIYLFPLAPAAPRRTPRTLNQVPPVDCLRNLERVVLGQKLHCFLDLGIVQNLWRHLVERAEQRMPKPRRIRPVKRMLSPQRCKQVLILLWHN
jgi:hypothetical protein